MASMSTRTDETAPRPRDERDVIRRAGDLLRRSIPPGWSLESDAPPGHDGASDDLWRLQDGGGATALLPVVAKVVLEQRDVPAVIERLREPTPEGEQGLVVARYISDPVQRRLAQLGISHLDLTGNMLVRSARPALFAMAQGATADPWRGPGRPPDTLRGCPAARVVRTLLDVGEPRPARRLVADSGASTGSVYRVLNLLEAEGLVHRDARRRFVVDDWVELARRWSQDHGFSQSGTVTRWLAPRGLGALMERIASVEGPRYAVTGSEAGATWAQVAPVRNAMVWTASPEQAAAAWGLHPVERGVNVLLAEPVCPVVLEGTVEREDGLVLAAPTQVAVDLMTGTGRAPSEAEALIGWMVSHESAWRR